MVKESVTKALADANVTYGEVKQAVCGYVYGMHTLEFFFGVPFLTISNRSHR